MAFIEMRGLDNSLGTKTILYSIVLVPKPCLFLIFSNN
jgi:hypothetical protein